MKKPRRVLLFSKTARLMFAVAALMAAGMAVFVDAFDDAFHERVAVRGGVRLAADLARRVHADPTAENIARLAEDAGVRMRYESPELSFATDDAMPGFGGVEIRRRLRRNFALAQGGGGWFALHRRGRRLLMVELVRRENPWKTAPGVIASLAAGLALLWLALYFLQRRMLSPLVKLRDDMKSAGAGEWRESQIVQNDEIGELAAEFNEMQRRLRAAMQSKERLLIDASHELRSPLARLRLAAEFVRDANLREKITADIAELDELTGGILAASSPQNSASTKKSPVAAAALFQALQTKYPKVKFAAAPAAVVFGDFAALARMLGNLLDNAQKFAASEVRMGAVLDGGELRITVEDDGPGAAAEDLPHLFEPFYRADASRSRDTGGFGLGLAIALAAAKAHGGNISAQNKTPHGLAATVRLPAKPAE